MNPQLINSLVTFGIMVALVYFMMIRPNKKRAEEAQEMYDSLAVGDAVVTIGGLHGVIDEVIAEDQTIVLDCEGIYLTFERRAVARVVSKATPQVAASEEQETDVSALGSNTPASAADEATDEVAEQPEIDLRDDE